MGGVSLNPFQRDSTTVDQGQIRANAQNRADLVAAQSDPNVDPVTKQELAKGLAKANSDGLGNYGQIDELLQALSAAKSGIGIYGIRKINENQKNLLASSPGRAQLTPSLGGQSTLGSFY